MKIAILSAEPPSSRGGSARYAWDQAQALARLGHEVHLIVGSRDGGYRSWREGSVTITRLHRGATLKRVLGDVARNRLPRFRQKLEAATGLLGALRAEHRRAPFDVVELLEGGSEGVFLYLPPEIPSVLRLHLPLPPASARTLDGLLSSLVERLALHGARALCADSQWLAGEVRSRLGVHKPIQVLPSGIDLARFDVDEGLDVNKRFGLPEAAVKVLCGANIEEQEGARVLLEASAELLERRQDVVLLLTGKDALNRIETELGRFLQGGRVFQLRPETPGEARALLKQCDLFLLPSLWESCPVPLLEAMAAGTAIVASDCGGVPELVRPEIDALLARTGESAAFLEAMEVLARDAKLRASLGRSARQRVEARYTDEEVARRALAFWSHALGVTQLRSLYPAPDPLEALGPSNWFQAWWLKGSSVQPRPVMALDAAGKPLFAGLSLDQFRFLVDLLSGVYWETCGRGGSPEALFLDDLARLYREAALEARSNGTREPVADLALPGLAHPFFQDQGRFTRFVDTVWWIQGAPAFVAWLVREVAAAVETGWGSTAFRRLAVLAVDLKRCPTTLDVLRAIYRHPERHARAVGLDREYFQHGNCGEEFKKRVDALGLHAPLEHPPVFQGAGCPSRTASKPFGPPLPEVTVLIPAFRHEAFVGEAVRSALRQTWPNLELLVVDDRSPDGTLEAARAAGDRRTRVEQNPERLGLGPSIRAALARIDSPFVALLNSDDLFHPDRLWRCLEHLSLRPEVSVVTTGIELIDSDGRWLDTRNPCLPELGPKAFEWVRWYAGIETGLREPGEWVCFKQLLRHNHLVTSSNIVCRTEYLRAKAEHFQELRYCVDWSVFLHAAAEGKLAWLPERLLGYRLHSANTVWFAQGGQAGYILEVNRVVARVLAEYARNALATGASPESLVDLLREGVELHGETDGSALFLSELLGRLEVSEWGKLLDQAAEERLSRMISARKPVEEILRSENIDPWELIARARQFPELRIRTHVVDPFIEHARRMEAEANRLSGEREAACRALEDAEASRRKALEDAEASRRKHDEESAHWVEEKRALAAAAAQAREEQERLAACLRDAHEESERIGAWAQAQAEEATRELERERQARIDEARERSALTAALEGERDREQAALRVERQHLVAVRQEAEELRGYWRQERLARHEEIQRLLQEHEWRAGRLLLRKLKLLSVFKTLDRISKIGAVWRDRIAAGKRPRVVIACPGAYPSSLEWDLPWEILELDAHGPQVRALAWQPGPTAGLRGRERKALGFLRLLREDRLLQTWDRRFFERSRPEQVAALSALLEGVVEHGRLFTFARSAKSLGAAYLHGFGLGLSAYQVFAGARVLGLPFGLSIRGPDLGRTGLREDLIGLLLREAALVAVDSMRTADDLSGIAGSTPKGLLIQPLGTGFGAEVARQPGSGFLLASIGPVSRGRDLFTLAEALRLCLDRGLEVQLSLLGAAEPTAEGLETMAWLCGLVSQLGLESRFRFEGEPSPLAVRELLGRAHALVATAVDREGLGHEGIAPALGAAMAAGLPVIASRAAAHDEAVREGETGLLVRPGDRDDLAAAIATLASEPDRTQALGAAGKARASEWAPLGRILGQRISRILGEAPRA